MSLLPYLFDVQRPFRLMDRDFLGPRGMSSIVPREFFNMNRHFDPWENMLAPLQNIVEPLERLQNAMHQLALTEKTNITADKEKFQVIVDVQHFSPDEIEVKVVDGCVVIEGKHKEKIDQHGYVSRQFVRRYPLPEGCLPDTVQSQLSSDGVLTVTAPTVLPLPSPGERIVPIAHTGPVKKQIASQEPVQNE